MTSRPVRTILSTRVRVLRELALAIQFRGINRLTVTTILSANAEDVRTYAQVSPLKADLRRQRASPGRDVSLNK